MTRRKGGGQFIGAVDPPESPTPLAWWFAFAGDRLVLEERRGEDYFELPRAVEVRALGLVPLGQHYLGILDGHDCWAVDLGLDTYLTLPEGFTTKQLRSLYGRMDDDLFAMSGRAIQISPCHFRAAMRWSAQVISTRRGLAVGVR